LFLDICGKLEFEGNNCKANFNSEQCNLDILDNTVPLFIIIEGFAQMASRGASVLFFNGAPCFPVLINSFDIKGEFRTVTFNNRELTLEAHLNRRNNYGVAFCRLHDLNEGVTISGEIWATIRTLN
jgi:hypothetical protein